VTTGDWAEARSGIHTLEDVNVQVFKLFLRWLYTGNIAVVNSDKDLDQLLVIAWALGDRLQARHFKNAVMNALMEDWSIFGESYPRNMKAAVLAYNLSAPGSKIRQLACKKFTCHTHDSWLDDQVLQLPNDLVVDFMKATSSIVAMMRDKVLDYVYLKNDLPGRGCPLYHEHGPGEGVCSESDIKKSISVFEEYELDGCGHHPFAPVKADDT